MSTLKTRGWRKARVRLLEPYGVENAFNPSQKRDASGRWSRGAGGSGSAGGKSGVGKGKEGGRGKAGGEIVQEKNTPPPPGKTYQPKVDADRNRDGVTDAARVGVPANQVPPPPPVGRLPNLTKGERRVESSFMRAYEKNPDKVAGDFRVLVHNARKPGEPPTFGTDDAKALTRAWSHKDPVTRAKNRATLNTALHQTANAIAKRAFVHELDTLKKGDEILVTVGGCGSGKGFALKNVPEALSMKSRSKVVWDSAGDQNATENVWIQREAEKRGLKVNYVFVHADPRNQ